MTGLVLRIDVTGTPAPQGSKSAFVNRYTGRAQMKESSDKVKPWRQDVRAAALAAADGSDGKLWTPPLLVKAILIFRFRRPQSHYRTGRYAGMLRDNAPHYVGTTPDLDKCCRSTFDALTSAGVILDDRTVVDFRAQKVYIHSRDQPGALIWLTDANNEFPSLERANP